MRDARACSPHTDSTHWYVFTLLACTDGVRCAHKLRVVKTVILVARIPISSRGSGEMRIEAGWLRSSSSSQSTSHRLWRCLSRLRLCYRWQPRTWLDDKLLHVHVFVFCVPAGISSRLRSTSVYNALTSHRNANDMSATEMDRRTWELNSRRNVFYLYLFVPFADSLSR